jgi:hypothetical protein
VYCLLVINFNPGSIPLSLSWPCLEPWRVLLDVVSHPDDDQVPALMGTMMSIGATASILLVTLPTTSQEGRMPLPRL